MTNTISQEERNRRAALIRQAIARGAARFFGGVKLLYPLSDYVLLAYQRPVCFSIWRRNGGLAYTTFRDPAIVSAAMLRSGAHLERLNECTIDLSILSPCLNAYYVTLHNVSDTGFSPVSAADISLLESILQDQGQPKYPDGFPEALLEAIEANFESCWSDSDCIGADVLSEKQLSDLLEPLRTALDAVIEEIRESKACSVTLSTGVSVPNLFAVVRTVRSPERRFTVANHDGPEKIFPYTASLLLSRLQRELLPAICDESNCDACVDTVRANCQMRTSSEKCIASLETPLSANARSIFDSVYYSGCIDFGLPGKTGEAGRWRDKGTDGGTGSDIRRREVEKCVYGVLSKGRDARIMYVPIHVGGAPWMSLFTFTDADDESAWDDNYCFYRDTIAKLSDRIRSTVQDIYIQRLIQDIKDAHSTNPQRFFNQVEKRWRAAAQIFPFRRYSLTQCSSTTAGALRMPGGDFAVLAESNNPFCHPQIDYGHLEKEHLRASILTALTSLELIEIRANEGIRGRLTSQAHTFLNILLSIKGTLDSALHSSDMVDVQKYAMDAAKNAAILEASLRVALNRPLPDDFPKDIVSMLDWLHETASYGDLKPELSWGGHMHFSTLTNTKEIISAFTVLWNLWDNAARVASGKINGWFKVFIGEVDDDTYMHIHFTNFGEMPRQWADYLNHRGSSPNTEKRPRGLEIVREKVHELAWRISCHEESGGATQIILYIPKGRLRPPLS